MFMNEINWIERGFLLVFSYSFSLIIFTTGLRSAAKIHLLILLVLFVFALGFSILADLKAEDYKKLIKHAA